jgi:hypothetical protein
VQFGALDDFDDPTARARGSHCRPRPLITCIGEDAHNEREQSSRTFVENQCRAVTILDVGRVNHCAQQQAERVYENMALLALDLLARVIAMRINVRPPFSALFTLWLSMIAAVGLTARSSCSLHAS